jgi:multiple sugar transport system permease protein
MISVPSLRADLTRRERAAIRRPVIERHLPLLLLTPTAVVLVAVLAYPWAWSFVVSFLRWSAVDPSPPAYIGLQNYTATLTSPEFWNALGVTLVLVGTSVPLEMLFGFLLAYMLHTDLRGRAIFQTMLIMPMMVMPVMVGVAWLVILHPVYGILPYWFGVLGLPEIGWMTSPRMAIVTVATVEVWRNTPMVMLILLAGLRSLPPDLSEAARIDGATAWQHIRYVVLPGIRPFIMFCLLIMTMFELRTFDTVFALFQSGGPGQGARVLGVYLYERFTNSFDFGGSSAIAYILLLITMMLSLWFARGAIRGADE